MSIEVKWRPFLKFPNFFFNLQGLAQTKTSKVVVFRKVSFETSSATYLVRQKKSIVVTGVNLVTEVEQP